MSQADSILTTILPRIHPAARTIYIPELAHPHGPYFPERMAADSYLPQIVSDIASGAYEGVIRVIGLDFPSGRAFDASVIVAKEVLAQVIDYEGSIPAHCEDFLEQYLGTNIVRNAEADAA